MWPRAKLRHSLRTLGRTLFSEQLVSVNRHILPAEQADLQSLSCLLCNCPRAHNHRAHSCCFTRIFFPFRVVLLGDAPSIPYSSYRPSFNYSAWYLWWSGEDKAEDVQLPVSNICTHKSWKCEKFLELLKKHISYHRSISLCTIRRFKKQELAKI